MSKLQKVQFTNGLNFNLTGNEYKGYFNIYDDLPYVGKENQNTPLQNNNTTDNEIILSNDFFDRTFEKRVGLKHSLESCLFEPNEIINKNSLNFKINQLYENFIQIYNFTKLPDLNLPSNFTNYAYVTGGLEDDGSGGFKNKYEIRMVPGSFIALSANLSTFPFSFINKNFEDNTSSAGVKMNMMRTRFDDEYTLFLSVSNTIFSYYVRDDSTSLTLTTSSGLGFNNIKTGVTSTASNNYDTLYIADSGNNSLYKLGTKYITFKDRSGVRKFTLDKTIGGYGTLNENFSGLKDIAFENKKLYVYDFGDKLIKKFDENLIFLDKYKNKTYFSNNNIVNLSIDPFFNKLYILSDNFKVKVLQADNYIQINDFEIESGVITDKNIEKAKKILFSKNDSNLYYLLTNKGFYKLLKNNNSVIGKYKFLSNLILGNTWEVFTTGWTSASGSSLYFWEQAGIADGITSLDFQDAEILENKGDFDTITLYASDKFFTIQENGNFINFLDSDNYDFYKKNEILLNDEYFNNLTLNTSIYKLLFNINLLSNSINKVLEVSFDFESLVYDNIRTLREDEKLDSSIENLPSFYIGNNESLQVNNFNRVAEKIYNYTDNILGNFRTKISNTLIPKLSTITF